MINKDWFKVKAYAHLTPKVAKSNANWVREYVQDVKKIESHRFFPMLHYTKVDKKYRRPKVATGKENLRVSEVKKREIYYANHLDSHVFSYYAQILEKLLNDRYQLDVALMDSVIAYRSIPHNLQRNKCNIDFANEVFSFIFRSDSTELSAICLDISNYFDTIDHKILKINWAGLLNRLDLPIDHYKLFRAITKYSFIEIGDILQNSSHKISKLSLLKYQDLESFYNNASEFRESIIGKSLLRKNRNNCGIPQGSPISAVLSNLYLLHFDIMMVKMAKLYGGMYRRYSDDIIFICDPIWIDRVTVTMKEFLSVNLRLNIQDKKTQRVDFKRESNQLPWETTLNEAGFKYKSRPLTYLGFDFDGKKIRIKQKSISSYYRKTKRIIRRAAYFARKAQKRNLNINVKKKLDSWIYKSKIYKQKTHLGSRKKTINNKIYWGNFLSYAYNASKIMEEPGIKKQLRHHWKMVESLIEYYTLKFELPESTSKNKKQSLFTRLTHQKMGTI
ncbi:MAG TPA: reverse transcriptase domain-containing protein [Saprospiraceae bacterium]|nr:reverse transcriptase domain-containing protein [Bacteroidia bacterium]HMZ39779.1 reverse transcriptase domain-containing protein [Saprospiraceae bacterium]HNA64318.1 reverse transcriptase domain-containing protein [Saprospiraceae bacterium]HNC36028.1 reverse transcriptase domain-containing protein [Saprospiraceae bacterium]HNE62136.1 reverse transcriptase domain-containing protein [Saprospiraceae bacterium]